MQAIQRQTWGQFLAFNRQQALYFEEIGRKQPLSVRPGMLSNPGLSGKLDLNGSQRAGRRRGAPPQQHVARWHAGESNAASLQGSGSCAAGTACQGRAIGHAGWHGPSGRAI